jgi:hypothetical protein
MPEYEDDLNDDDTVPRDDDEGMRGLRQAKKAAETRAKDAETALAAANAERREYAAVKAGLDPASKQAQFFLSHYDGEPTPDAIKSAAIEAGIIDDGDAATQQAAAAQQTMAQAFGGGETVPLGTQPVGPGLQVPAQELPMWQAYEAKLKAGDFNGAGEVLRQFGRSTAQVAGHEMLPGGNVPQSTPL